jgi:probable F420-dependent oxidoreductase
LQIGVVTPVVTLNPRAHAKWERDATWEDVVAVAHACDDLGVHCITASEHIAVPASVADVRGARYYEPFTALAALAAVTRRVRLCTYVLVLGYHHPLDLAKRAGTLDVVSGGRVILGVGVGTLREEFDLLGFPFEGRGERADDALRALRASLSQREPAPFPGWIVDPCAVQERVPIWIGGRTRRSLRRAVELADGWAPFGLSADGLRDAVNGAGALPAGFDLVLRPENAIDPGAQPDAARRTVDELVAIGATVVNLRFVSQSRDHWVDQLARMVDLVAAG